MTSNHAIGHPFEATAPRLGQVLLVAAIPLVVFLACGAAMSALSGRRAALASSHPPNPTPLNMRPSYDAADMSAFFQALGPVGLASEQRFLEADLVFPSLYGAALAGSLLWLRRRAHRPLMLPVGLVMAGVTADWTENLLQLELLRRYTQGGEAGLDPNLVAAASVATLVKLVAVGAGFLLVLSAAGGILSRRS